MEQTVLRSHRVVCDSDYYTYIYIPWDKGLSNLYTYVHSSPMYVVLHARYLCGS